MSAFPQKPTLFSAIGMSAKGKNGLTHRSKFFYSITSSATEITPRQRLDATRSRRLKIDDEFSRLQIDADLTERDCEVGSVGYQPTGSTSSLTS